MLFYSLERIFNVAAVSVREADPSVENRTSDGFSTRLTRLFSRSGITSILGLRTMGSSAVCENTYLSDEGFKSIRIY